MYRNKVGVYRRWGFIDERFRIMLPALAPAPYEGELFSSNYPF